MIDPVHLAVDRLRRAVNGVGQAQDEPLATAGEAIDEALEAAAFLDVAGSDVVAAHGLMEDAVVIAFADDWVQVCTPVAPFGSRWGHCPAAF